MESSHQNRKSKLWINVHIMRKWIIQPLENYFYWHGKTVSSRPYLFICLCILITGLCSIGFLNFTTEVRPFKLWIPQDSEFIKVYNWHIKNFPTKLRPQFVLFEAENVLDKSVLLEMMAVHNVVFNISSRNITYNDICTRIPKLVNLPISRQRRFSKSQHRLKRQIEWLSSIFRIDYCNMIESLETECFEESILEIWSNNATILISRSQQQIYDDINSVKISPVFGIPLNVSKYLGIINYDMNFKIIGAKSAKHIWVTNVNFSSINNGNGYVDDTGIGMVVDKNGFEWEGQYLDNLLKFSDTLQHSKIYIMALSSFGRVSDAAMFADASTFGLGFCVVFIYVKIMLGKFNCKEQRPILALFGISCVGYSILVSYGLCSAFSVPFTPVNNIVPFLILGIGVDDMFVITQSFDTLSPEEKLQPFTIRMGLALRHAGVSITITSITDFMAFSIGCSTVLPALRSFCLYAALGILSVYIFQATFFVAWFALDQKRLERGQNGMFWCVKDKSIQPNECSHKNFSQLFFENILGRVLRHNIIKYIVIITTLAIFGTSCWGLSKLRQEFDPIWLLPQSSYLYKYNIKLQQYFPSHGSDGVIYFSGINLYAELPNIFSLIDQVKSLKYISSVDSWADSYKLYLDKLGYDIYDTDVDESHFYTELGQFLYSPDGAIYKMKNFIFEGNSTCIDPTVQVSASSIEFKYKILYNSFDRISAMDQVKNIIDNMNFTGYVKAWAVSYSTWETDKIIEFELYRNLSMAMSIVFLLTFILIGSFPTSFMVLICVVFTMVNVSSLMHWWGLTIDTVSCVYLVLAIGLCVDYAAHIGHTFMTQTGTRNERMQSSLAKIGPAVLNGGLSTFLAFVFLANSESYIFNTFFKIFFLVILFGLYHGLVFLPVMLSIFGPKSYEKKMKEVGKIPEDEPFHVSDNISPGIDLQNV